MTDGNINVILILIIYKLSSHIVNGKWEL